MGRKSTVFFTGFEKPTNWNLALEAASSIKFYSVHFCAAFARRRSPVRARLAPLRNALLNAAFAVSGQISGGPSLFLCASLRGQSFFAAQFLSRTRTAVDIMCR